MRALPFFLLFLMGTPVWGQTTDFDRALGREASRDPDRLRPAMPHELLDLRRVARRLRTGDYKIVDDEHLESIKRRMAEARESEASPPWKQVDDQNAALTVRDVTLIPAAVSDGVMLLLLEAEVDAPKPIQDPKDVIPLLFQIDMTDQPDGTKGRSLSASKGALRREDGNWKMVIVARLDAKATTAMLGFNTPERNLIPYEIAGKKGKMWGHSLRPSDLKKLDVQLRKESAHSNPPPK